ncbi:thymidine kinase domain-containing protein [Ditylenchus destructor]|uniref:Thymidine kinase n=1 Tax=Ditylenchus destructor TaxID=166010 RepID=A0AAD4RCU8_9BILA|nr:thymidine kinase domain-containing protein [Ditylenchus destructor]
MFSGKTTELFRLTKRHNLAGKRVVIVKYARDTRYDSSMACTHDMNKMEAISAVTLAEVYPEIQQYDVVGIDEGQFFEDLVMHAQELANSGKVVIIAALNGDYRQKPFQNVTMLFSIAEKIDKLSAVCRSCGHSASFTFRKLQSAKREIIGGEEIYQAVCRACVIDLYNQQKAIENDTSICTIISASLNRELSPVKRMVSVENLDANESVNVLCKKRANG